MSAIPNYEETDCKLANEERRRESTRVYFVPHHKTQPTSLQEALRALRAYSISKCDETVEVSLFCNLFVNKNRSKRRDPFKGTILFPHTFGKEPKLLVFAKVSVGRNFRSKFFHTESSRNFHVVTRSER